VELEHAIDSMRAAAPATLLLDAGDVMTGNPITEREYHGAKGGLLFAMMNELGYDAWTPGNHDLDISQENLRALAAIAQFPTVNANLVDAENQFRLNNRPTLIVERGGIRIGIIGIMLQDLYAMVNQKNLIGVRVLPPVETVQRYVDELDPQTDLIIALTHQGVEDDSVLASRVHGLDVIVGGHSHTRLKRPKTVNGVVIVQTGSNAENLGYLDLVVDDDAVSEYAGGLVQLWVQPGRPRTPLAAVVDSIQGEIDREYSEVIGVLKGDWVRGPGETAIGQFVANAQREAAGAEIGFMNTHGMRRDATAGPLTKKDLFEILPFANTLTTFQISGKELKTVLEHYVDRKSEFEINGVDAVWTMGADGHPEFGEITVQGKPFDERRQYLCAASDYFVGEARRYMGIVIQQPVFLPTSVFSAAEAAVRAAGEIATTHTARIRRAK
jgi:2',3'-cyclic-nucleotide 2'-phosphodiesterase (5'-nucleotidase family)